MSIEKRKPIPERNEKGQYHITAKFCCEISEYNGYYSSPGLIYNLFLHFKGFSKIENFDSFVNVRVLYLENNCIQRIEGISHMKQLSCLYLSNNFISKMENLELNTELSILNISGNKIKCLEGLEPLTKLGNLYMDKNLIEDIDGLRGILQCQSISVLDIQNNYLESGHIELIKVLNEMRNLKVLYLKGNPIVRNISFYRKTLIKEIENMTYLDDRPVDQGDQLAAQAFFAGGMEAERKAREDYRKTRDMFFKVRDNPKEKDREPFEERKRKALESLRTEYITRKDNLEQKKKNLMKELEALSSSDKTKKNEIVKTLSSLDYQIDENEKFKVREETDVMATISKRENVDRFSTFEYEDWMETLFEVHVVGNFFDFSVAVKLIKLDFKTRNVKNWELFNELDLRSKWTELENKKFGLLDTNENIVVYDNRSQEELNTIIDNNQITDLTEGVNGTNTAQIINSEQKTTESTYKTLIGKEEIVNTTFTQSNFEDLD